VLNYRLKIGPQEIALYPGETLVGRSEECTICLDDERLSRVHAKFVLDGDGDGAQVTLTDLGSRNGTYVNDERLKDRKVLHSGDRIRMGQTEMRFTVSGRRKRHTSSSRTLGGATMLDMSPPASEEADVLHRVLQLGRVDEAEKILKARVANLVRTDPPLRAEHMLSRNVITGMIAMADRSVDPRWLHRLFKLHATCGWWMSDQDQKRVEQLIRAFGRVGGDGLTVYLNFWSSRQDELSDPQRVQLARLRELASRDSAIFPEQ
jgi:pSer/pThr/pTyr-binding forkhead associated (FHA) protein